MQRMSGRMIAALLLMLTSQVAEAETFGISKDEFLNRLDKALEKDASSPETRDKIVDCKPKGNSVILCSLTDRAFRQSVANLKKLNLLNGKFQQQIKISVKTEGTNVAEIGVAGTRADPANLIQLNGFVMTVAQTLSPTLSTDEASNLALNNWKLMRGDNDPTIGKTVTDIQDWGEIDCTSFPSTESMIAGCIFLPRS